MTTVPDLEHIIRIAERADAAALRIRTMPRPRTRDAADWVIVTEADYELAEAIRLLEQRADETGSERDRRILRAARHIANYPGYAAEAAEHAHRIVANGD